MKELEGWTLVGIKVIYTSERLATATMKYVPATDEP
jgi:hypothetical protein